MGGKYVYHCKYELRFHRFDYVHLRCISWDAVFGADTISICYDHRPSPMQRAEFSIEKPQPTAAANAIAYCDDRFLRQSDEI